VADMITVYGGQWRGECGWPADGLGFPGRWLRSCPSLFGQAVACAELAHLVRTHVVVERLELGARNAGGRD